MPIDTQIIEQFKMNGNLSVDDQTQIVDAVNRLMADQNVLILRDNGNATWICLHYRPIKEERNEQQIGFLCPIDNFKWQNYNKFNAVNTKKINEWLRNLNVANINELFLVVPCQTSSNSAEQLLLTLVYAFGSCLKFPKCYCKPFGESKEKIHQAIAKALIDNQMPTIEEMWGV